MMDNSNARNVLPEESRIEDQSFEADIYRAVEIALGSFRETELREAMNRAFYNSYNPFKQGYDR